MRFIAASLVYILTALYVAPVFSAEEITHISVIHADTGRETASKRRLPAGFTRPKIADRLVLHAGKSGKYMITVTEVDRSQFGNTIIRGNTPAGGKALLVISPAGFITGNFYQYDGRVMVTTDKDGAITAWREGIDALALPIDDGAVIPRYFESGTHLITEDGKTVAEASNRPRTMNAEASSKILYPTFRAGASELSVLIYYDDTMTDPFGVADYLTRLTDGIFLTSDVAIKLKVSGSISVPISDEALHRDVHTLMENAEPPFTDIESDLLAYDADIAVLLRDTRSQQESFCGIADYGVRSGVRDSYSTKAVVEWLPEGNGKYCFDKTLAHEIGHLLGAAHHRADYADPINNAYSYSFAYNSDSFATVMVPGGSVDDHLYKNQFSNPRLRCLGDKCGVDSSEEGSADNAKTFLNTAPLVADEGIFNFENVTPFRYENQVSSCEKDGLEGFFEGTGIFNRTKYDIELASHHFLRSNGTSYEKVFERGEKFLERNFRVGWGWCVTPENESQLRSEYTETFTRYYHPVTDDVVEIGHLHWEEDYDGEYSLIHIAATTGGRFTGHPQRSVKVGSDHEIHFEPDYGYELSELRTSCDGERSDNVFTVNASIDNCRVELIFASTLPDPQFYTVTPVQSLYGAMTPSDPQRVLANDNATFTLVPDDGYRAAAVLGSCGGSITDTTYTTDAITGDCSAEVEFELIPTYLVTAIAGDGGEVAFESDEALQEGQQATLVITPEESFVIAKVEGSCGGNLLDNKFITDPITDDCYVEVSFKADVGAKAQKLFSNLLQFLTRSKTGG